MTSHTEKLIERLNHMLDVEGGGSFVSPTSRPSGGASALPGGIYIHKNMDYEQLTQNQLLLVHTLLHNFYASGHRELSKQDIEQLHRDLKEKIKHNDFDKLDKDE